jgi:cobalt-zinc-cadmium efflux system protein
VFPLVAVGRSAWEALRRQADPEPPGGCTVIAGAAVSIAVNGVTTSLFVTGREEV